MLPYAANDYFCYMRRGPNKLFPLDMHNERLRSEAEVVIECGAVITEMRPQCAQALIDCVTTQLDMGGAVMIPVDRYEYDAPHNRYFQETHLEHWILVYERSGPVFRTIEVNAKICSGAQCSLLSAWDGYQGYVNNFGVRGVHLVGRSGSPKASLEDARARFAAGSSTRVAGDGNVGAIAAVIDELRRTQAVENGGLLCGERLKNFDRRFFHMRRAKDVEVFQIATFLGEPGEGLIGLNRQVYDWMGELSLTTGVVARRGNVGGGKRHERIITLLQGIYDIERDYYQQLRRLSATSS